MLEVATRSDTVGDEGPVTRFYLQLEAEHTLDPFSYQSKPTREEKDAGLSHFRRQSGAEATGSKEGQARLESPRTGAGRKGGVRNSHGTVKSEVLMRYFVRLTCPKGGVALDLFTGSGTIGVAAIKEGYRYIGYDINNSDAQPYVEISRARITWADGAGELVPRESLRAVVSGKGMLG
jgi:site-specific DNA-methyltransferase (adenine-specific)